MGTAVSTLLSVRLYCSLASLFLPWDWETRQTTKTSISTFKFRKVRNNGKSNNSWKHWKNKAHVQSPMLCFTYSKFSNIIIVFTTFNNLSFEKSLFSTHEFLKHFSRGTIKATYSRNLSDKIIFFHSFFHILISTLFP